MFDFLSQKNTVVSRTHQPGIWENRFFTPDPGITEISEGAFMGSDLRGIRLPETIGTIGRNAFAFCMELTEITIPASVTEIPQGLFYCCENLKKVCFEVPPVSIGSFAFAGCYRLEEFRIGNIAHSLEDLIGHNIAQSFAFFGCGCDIREELTEEAYDTPQFESKFYRQSLFFYQDATIDWSQISRKAHWQRRDPEQFQWMPGIPLQELETWLETNQLRLPTEYRTILERTNGAELFRQMMTLYAVPTAEANPWQEDHSLKLLNDPETRDTYGIPEDLFLLGTTELGSWFGVIRQEQPKMAEFFLRDRSVKIYDSYRDWKLHVEVNFQYDPVYWEMEDRLRDMEKALDDLEGTELNLTDLFQIQNKVNMLRGNGI